MDDILEPMKAINDDNWFEDWFDSEYYHILYQDRDEAEAKAFLNRLMQKLHFENHHKILDLACGRGRHTNYLASLGMNITGYDLSVSSIEYATETALHPVNFGVRDMRKPFGNNEFDIILNLFTSFGYFENESENLQVMHNISKALKPNGIVVIEYLNPDKVIKNLIALESKHIENITFEISKSIKESFIYKNIKFNHNGENHDYTEKVMLIYKKQFEKYFSLTNLTLLNVFGNHQFNPYHESTSSRMILVAQKL